MVSAGVRQLGLRARGCLRGARDGAPCRGWARGDGMGVNRDTSGPTLSTWSTSALGGGLSNPEIHVLVQFWGQPEWGELGKQNERRHAS